MRTAQVNLHVELFGDQVPRGFPEDRPCSFHVYADSFNSPYEAIAAAVSEFASAFAEAGGTFGVRVESASTASGDKFERGIAGERSGRLVDLKDALALVNELRGERGEGSLPPTSVEGMFEALYHEARLAHERGRDGRDGGAE